jgi:hypothetical protein
MESTAVERRVQLPPESAERLRLLAEQHHVSEDQILVRAIEVLFDVAGDADGHAERGGFSSLSEGALERVWDNDEDAAYDDWRKLYGVPAR